MSESTGQPADRSVGRSVLIEDLQFEARNDQEDMCGSGGGVVTLGNAHTTRYQWLALEYLYLPVYLLLAKT